MAMKTSAYLNILKPEEEQGLLGLLSLSLSKPSPSFTASAAHYSVVQQFWNPYF
jgi:hypothetical protein